MLVKLRRQFILIIMALVTAALVIMAGVITYINYQQLSTDVFQAVEYATTEMAFADRGPMREDLLDEGRFDNARKGDHRRDSRVPSANMVATSVFLVDSDGTSAQTLQNALELSEDEFQTALQAVYVERGSATAECVTGHLQDGDLYFGVRETMSGTKVAFASGSYITNSITNLALLLAVLAAVCACVWVAFLVISIFLARWVVRPTERAWNQQQQFVADASHELKTPLAVMMANNSILLSHADETVESQRRWVESNQQEAHQMLDLVNDMLFLARPENAERQQVRDTVDFSELVERNLGAGGAQRLAVRSRLFRAGYRACRRGCARRERSGRCESPAAPGQHVA